MYEAKECRHMEGNMKIHAEQQDRAQFECALAWTGDTSVECLHSNYIKSSRGTGSVTGGAAMAAVVAR